MDTINDRLIDDVRAVLTNGPRLPAADEIAADALSAASPSSGQRSPTPGASAASPIRRGPAGCSAWVGRRH